MVSLEIRNQCSLLTLFFFSRYILDCLNFCIYLGMCLNFDKKISARILIEMGLILALLRDFAVRVNSSSSSFNLRCFAKAPAVN